MNAPAIRMSLTGRLKGQTGTQAIGLIRADYQVSDTREIAVEMTLELMGGGTFSLIAAFLPYFDGIAIGCVHLFTPVGVLSRYHT